MKVTNQGEGLSKGKMGNNDKPSSPFPIPHSHVVIINDSVAYQSLLENIPQAKSPCHTVTPLELTVYVICEMPACGRQVSLALNMTELATLKL